MKSRKNLLKKSRVYLILNRQSKSRVFLEGLCSDLSYSGIGIVQLRDKAGSKGAVLDFARKLSRYLDKSRTLFIVNDYVDIALLADADGVHLGQADASVREARKILGKKKIIGVSCHSLAQAIKAQKQGADYIGIGPVFATPTKPEYKPIGLKTLSLLKDKIKIPYFAIGDIHEENIREVISRGASRVAVCRAVLKAKNPKAAAARINRLLRKK